MNNIEKKFPQTEKVEETDESKTEKSLEKWEPAPNDWSKGEKQAWAEVIRAIKNDIKQGQPPDKAIGLETEMIDKAQSPKVTKKKILYRLGDWHRELTVGPDKKSKEDLKPETFEDLYKELEIEGEIQEEKKERPVKKEISKRGEEPPENQFNPHAWRREMEAAADTGVQTEQVKEQPIIQSERRGEIPIITKEHLIIKDKPLADLSDIKGAQTEVEAKKITLSKDQQLLTDLTAYLGDDRAFKRLLQIRLKSESDLKAFKIRMKRRKEQLESLPADPERDKEYQVLEKIEEYFQF